MGAQKIVVCLDPIYEAQSTRVNLETLIEVMVQNAELLEVQLDSPDHKREAMLIAKLGWIAMEEVRRLAHSLEEGEGIGVQVRHQLAA